MRVTQTMLSSSSLQQINQGYNRLGTIRDQMSGKKITRASQDPVVAMKGMRYRTQVTEIDQFKRNLGEAYNWMDTAESALDQATETLKRIRELTTQAANDSNNTGERENISKEVKQLREHLQSIANTKNSNKYIFNGTDTTNPPVSDMKNMDLGLASLFNDDGTIDETSIKTFELIYDGKTFKHIGQDSDGKQVFQDEKRTDVQLTIDQGGERIVFSEPNSDPKIDELTLKDIRTNDVIVSSHDAVSINTQTVEIELLKGFSIPVNINPNSVFSNALFGDIIRLENALQDPNVTGEHITEYIDNVYGHIDSFVSERAELGARINRAEMMENRLMDQGISAKKIMSDNEDADLEEVIINLTIQESIHRAALAVGARIIQPSLIDFLR